MERPEQLVRDLRRRANTLLSRKKVKREQLAYESGVTYSWLCKFLAEHEDASNPRVGTLVKLEKRLAELERVQ